MLRALRWLPLLLGAGIAVASCSSPNPHTVSQNDPGTLIAVSLDGKVGVLLDEIPMSMRERVATALAANDEAFWIDRAKQQLRLTGLRLVFRKYFYDESENKKALPIPPEEKWNITLVGKPARTMVDGHDVVAVSYLFESTLLSDLDSPAASEPMLGDKGGRWDEKFVFPIDPTLLLQRTGYACMDEDQYPPESVDAENAYLFYDDTCEVETAEERSCHYTDLPQESCVEALEKKVGRVDASIHYERLGWDENLANKVRSGEITQKEGPDLKVLISGLELNYIVYRYFPPTSCAIADGCIGAPGWRRLITFDSHDHNVGAKPLHIGDVDYYLTGGGTDNEDHGVYEFSACHEHYHFKYYGDFSFGSGASTQLQKNGFCLESTDRLSNNESTPLNTEYSECVYQGVEAGWGDNYQAGLQCNWVDITDLDTSAGPVTDKLTFHSNPDGFLCEGTLVKDAMGKQVWEPTSFTTDKGDPVDRPKCQQLPGTELNDKGSIQLTVPQAGGLVTAACKGNPVGPLRNCGFQAAQVIDCTPGEMVTLDCTVTDTTKPQVVRVCEASKVLGGGMECELREALGNSVVEGTASLTFTCPPMRDADEPGGQYALYTAPVWEKDGTQTVTCVAK